MPSESIDPRKAALVGDFLKEAFAGDTVHDTAEFDRDCQVYRIDESGSRRVRHRVPVDRDFLDDHTEEQIIERLQAWKVPDVIRQAGDRSVLVTNTGCVIETEQNR